MSHSHPAKLTGIINLDDIVAILCREKANRPLRHWNSQRFALATVQSIVKCSEQALSVIGLGQEIFHTEGSKVGHACLLALAGRNDKGEIGPHLFKRAH